MVRSEIKSGKVLLAEPFMMDPNFRRSAILLCEHTSESSIGFIMNKPLDVRIDELIEGFPEFESTVLFGGPVQTDTIHYIHNAGAILDGSRRIVDGVFWGGDFEKLKFLIQTQLIQPEDIRFFVGYSGWSEGQLLDEMSYGSWLLSDMDANYLFKTRPDHLWRQVMTHKGDTFAIIAGMPEQLIWN